MAGELITALPAVLSLGTCTRARALSLPGRWQTPSAETAVQPVDDRVATAIA